MDIWDIRWQRVSWREDDEDDEDDDDDSELTTVSETFHIRWMRVIEIVNTNLISIE